MIHVSSFDLDLQTSDRVDYGMLRLVNQTLATTQLPVVVWELDKDAADTFSITRITNNTAMILKPAMGDAGGLLLELQGSSVNTIS